MKEHSHWKIKNNPHCQEPGCTATYIDLAGEDDQDAK